MRRSTAISATILGILVLLGYYFFGFRPKGDYAQATVVLGGQEFRADVADTIDKQALGLSGRESLGEREGMFFLFGGEAEQTFWMKDMNFPIDIIWIKGNRVVGFAENAQPEPGTSMLTLKIYRSPEPVDKVFEVQAGVVAKLSIKVGDALVIQ